VRIAAAQTASVWGNEFVEPVADEERLVVADIDVTAVRGERQNLCPAAHYFRGDGFEVRADRRRLDPDTFND